MVRLTGAAAFGLIVVLACGGEEPPAETVEAPQPAADRRHAAPDDSGAPVIERVDVSPDAPRSGDQVVAAVSASDPDGDEVELEYRWSIDGDPVGEASAFLSLEGVSRGSEVAVTVIASDGERRSAPARASVRVGNQPPRVLSVSLDPSGDLQVGRELVARPEGDDPDGDRVSFHYRWLLDGEPLPDAGPTLSGDRFERGDSISLEVVASDGTEEGETFRTEPIEVGNAAPRITSTPGAIGADGVFRYEVAADDPDGDTAFRYRLVEAPAGMTIGFDDGAIAWRPGDGAEGNHAVEVEVSDLFGGRATQPFEIRLSYAPAKAAPPASASEGEAGDAEVDADLADDGAEDDSAEVDDEAGDAGAEPDEGA
jgi:hypothetical protein